VSDQGVGIAREHQERIFGRFERIGSARHAGGMGLGLYVSQQIVEGHGGTIRVASEEGAGATFEVELPLGARPEVAAPGEEAGSALPTELPSAPDVRPPPDTGDPGDGRSILVVDDDADVRQVLDLALGLEGFQVVTAADGREALEKLEAADPPVSLILLDLMMPVMDGWEFRRRQRGTPAADVPVVVLSAAENVSNKLGDIAPDGLLTKPITLDALVDTIRSVVDRSGPTLHP
jgi:CheY-like chemotaxis protein